jgi:HNH endonuclease
MTISDEVRNLVRERAYYRCEYCQMSSDCIYAKMHVDHIKPQTRGGSDEPYNLCYACPNCNLAKGMSTHATDPTTGEMIALFDPRTQNWSEHFTWADDLAMIAGLTANGRVTVVALKMNEPESLSFRRLMVAIGSYPPK